MLLLLLALAKSRTLRTVTFTSSTNWTPPPGTVRLETLVGRGQDGDSGTPDIYGWHKHYIAYLQRMDGSVEGPIDQGYGPDVYDGSSPPAAYCDPVYPITDSTVYQSGQNCYEFPVIVQPGSPSSNGADASAFGKTFSGGVAGPATSSSFSNVALTAGTAYPITVPGGATITITFYQ